MQCENLSHPFDILYEDLPEKDFKSNTIKWSTYKKYFYKKCNIEKIKRRQIVNIQTISVASTKRALIKIFQNFFKSRYTGYEQFLSEEEKRFICDKNNRELVEGGWMTIPRGLSNCPPGLEYLSMIDQLLVHQKVELLESFVGFETNNKYTVKNNIGQKVYFAVEDNDCCTRNCCGPMRPFEMKIYDNFQNEVIHLHRPLACDSCWCPCWLQSMEVSAPPGTVIGSIEQEWSICKPCYVIKNSAGDIVLRIKGPLCTYSICGNVEFNVYSKDGDTKVGKITKQWSGLAREIFTDADYFGITLPMDLDVRIKAVLLGACFLIDYMFFEKSRNREQDGPGML